MTFNSQPTTFDFRLSTFHNLINTAMTSAIYAGFEILKIYQNPKTDFSIEKKADNSPLTIADKAAHRIIMKELKKTGLPILSEEGKDIPYEERKDWHRFWLVDPLDGTKEFIKRNGEFTVNIALIEDGKPVAGVIYVPVSKTLYAGIWDEGAWKKEGMDTPVSFETLKAKGIRLPSQTRPKTFTLVGSRSHMNQETEDYMSQRRCEHGDVTVIAKGSSLKICLVAENAAHEYPRFGPTMEWDTAAGHAIAKAAGKQVVLVDKHAELCYNKEDLQNPFFIVKGAGD
jgi:3'(2'), 5'-bisphosphate nucleotidase